MMNGYDNGFGGYGSSGYTGGNSLYNSNHSNGFGGGGGHAGSIVNNWQSARGFSDRGGASDTDKAIASSGGAAAVGLAVKTVGMGKISAAVGLGAAASPMVGIASIAAVGAVGAIGLVHNSPALARGAKHTLKLGAKFLGKAKDALMKTHNTYKEKAKTKSNHLEKFDEATKQRAEKFKSFVKDSRSKLVAGKDIKENLTTLHQLKVPTQKSKKELHNLTADYVIKNNLKEGKLDFKGVTKDIKSFAKEAKLSRAETRDLKAGVNRRVEEHKDNFVMDKNNKVTNLNKNRDKAKQNAKEIDKKHKKVEAKQKQEKVKKAEKRVKVQPPKEKTKETGKALGR